eukprot:CAMPEP_0197706300 /NCGR_PEP_ID=MMETSP1338-20131121/126875_1 /TAXON_ID=43686 ORGANISM="Pelagodinium beii, Strain RCC1491" /NCGR_SAMPLE_ID=MMETSP1338 /ASSEMBLY_ACC=CAM_ASM_000754 /LENGTH=72 /DNA_ID=CAMNT_0043290211 /DNA_START=701 /DNA_END=919 /DNA_ORIENTATION=+
MAWRRLNHRAPSVLHMYQARVDAKGAAAFCSAMPACHLRIVLTPAVADVGLQKLEHTTFATQYSIRNDDLLS